MLWPAQQLQECQSAQLEADAGSQAYWLQQYSRDTLAQLPGSADDAFGGQTVTQERLGRQLRAEVQPPHSHTFPLTHKCSTRRHSLCAGHSLFPFKLTHPHKSSSVFLPCATFRPSHTPTPHTNRLGACCVDVPRLWLQAPRGPCAGPPDRHGQPRASEQCGGSVLKRKWARQSGR
jgi:hypothetical protein